MTVDIIHPGTLHLTFYYMHSYTLMIPENIVRRFYIIGVNHRQASAAERGLFSIREDQYEKILEQAKQMGLRSVFVLSTCNRAELYAFCSDPQQLKELFLMHTQGGALLWERVGITMQGYPAFEYLFQMAAGFQSQIMGDYEILGQLKKAVAFARERQMIGPLMDRTINFTIQASKAIKTQTQFSTGTVSVSYAAVEWLKRNGLLNNRRILVYGTGKFGRSIAKNLQYYGNAQVVIVNRTNEIARAFASECSLEWQPFENLAEQISLADIIIVCTNASSYTVLPQHFMHKKQYCVLDLSIPMNVHPAVKEQPWIQVEGIDDVSQLLRETLEKRKEEMPRALAILQSCLQDFYQWLAMQPYAPLLKEMKDKLMGLSSERASRQRINKTVGELAENLRIKKEKGCQLINAYNYFLSLQ